MAQPTILFLSFLVSFATVATVAMEVKVGDRVPDFTLNGTDGKTYKLNEFTKDKKTIVLEWFNKDCPYVHKFYDSGTMQGLQKDATGKGVIWLTIASSAEGKQGHLTMSEGAKVYSDKNMKSTALLLDTKGLIGKLYNAKTTPHMFVIAKTGKLAYEGAIDDQPSAQAKSLEGAQNYVQLALASLAENKPVKTNSTAPYGCSVKY